MKNIAMIEFIDEAKSFLNQSIKDYNIIALQPNVQIYLKNYNISYENTLHYFSNKEHQKTLLKSEEWYNFLVNKIDINDSEIKKSFNNIFLFYIRVCYMNHFLMYVEMLDSICSKHKINSISACIHENKFYPHHPLIQEDERYVGIISKKFAENKNITWKNISNQTKFNNINNHKKNLNFNTNKSFSKIVKYLMNDPSKKRVFLAGDGYNINYLVEKSKSKLPNITWTTIQKDITFRETIKCIYRKIFKNYIEKIPIDIFTKMDEYEIKNKQILEKNIDKFIKELQNNSNYFNYKGVNFIDIFLEKIKKDLKLHIINLYIESIALRKIFKLLNIKICISPFALDFSLLAAEICRNKNIPTLMISHGTLKIPKNELEHIEYVHMSKSLILSEFFNNVAIQVPNEIDVCNYYNCKSNLIKTGNLIFSKSDNENKKEYKKKILGDIDNKTKIFIYPENTRFRHGMRFHVFETFDEFSSSVSDLINAINEIDNTHLVIRLHPGRQIKPKDFKLLLPSSNKLTITSFDQPFFELLSIADILINFSSTVIEDALQNYIPVILYDKRKRYKHIISSQELNSNINPSLNAVYYIKETLYLKEGLQWIINNHLNKNISNSIFDRYVFKDNYYYNFHNFISNKTGEDINE